MFSNTAIVKSAGYVYSLQITQTPGNLSPNLLKIEGYYKGATQAWLQFFDSLGVPANGTTALYEESLGVVAPNGFSWQFNPGLIMRTLSRLYSASNALLSGLIVCVSTTQGTLTLATGTNQSSFFVTLEAWETLPNVTTTIIGDTTTAVTSLAVWADGTFHTIDKICYSNATANALFLQLYTQIPVAGVTQVEEQWPVIANAALTELNFRGVGFIPETQDPTTSPPTIHNGCYLYMSTTPNVLTAPAGTPATLQLNYFS